MSPATHICDARKNSLLAGVAQSITRKCFDAVPAVLVGHLHLYAVLQQPVEVAVGIDCDLLGTILRELFDGLRVGVGRQTRVQAPSATHEAVASG